jgi:hypothetical protein
VAEGFADATLAGFVTVAGDAAELEAALHRTLG